MDRERIETLLDEYRSAVARHVRAQADANACQTPSDMRRMHRAEENEEEVREQVIEALTKVGA